jgi:hypothetical protein
MRPWSVVEPTMTLAERRRNPEAVLELLRDGSDVIVGLGNGEPIPPTKFRDELEAAAKAMGYLGSAH